MRIDSLSGSADRAGRFKAVFSDGTVLRLYRQTVEDFGLYPGKELTAPEMEALHTEAGRMSAKMRAVRIVSASNVSARDLQQRLVHKGEDPTQAREAVRWMEELELVDDANTAELIVSRCIQKGYGLSRAKQALYEKRIPKSLWDSALADYPCQTDKIQAFLESRLSAAHDPREVKRAVDALMRRGHTYSAIRKALDSLHLESEDPSEEEPWQT